MKPSLLDETFGSSVLQRSKAFKPACHPWWERGMPMVSTQGYIISGAAYRGRQNGGEMSERPSDIVAKRLVTYIN